MKRKGGNMRNFVFFILILYCLAPLVFADTGMMDTQFILTWNENKEIDLAEYKLYYGPESGYYSYSLDVGLDTIQTIEWFSNVDIFCSITAIDFAGNESECSVEVMRLYGDTNLDDRIDVLDWYDVFRRQGATVGHDRYKVLCDLDRNDKINVIDLFLMQSLQGRENAIRNF
jgi:hypothetical protein